jgi:hypothetical protein
MMRAIVAASFVFIAMVATMVGTTALGLAGWRAGIVMCVGLVSFLTLAMVLFNHRGLELLRFRSAEEHIRVLEAAGELVDVAFTARRAFAVAELGDEGSHYFIELDDGRVLYLSGQYLYDYEPISDDPEVAQPRRFPCSAFTVRRLKHEGYVVDIICVGEVLEPEAVAKPFSRADWKAGLVPRDGEILTDTSYDALKLRYGIAS